MSRYGSAKSSKTVSKYVFIDPKRSGVEISGQFSVREFRSGDLLVLAVFFLPSLKLADVTLQLLHPWTTEQIDSALAAYPTVSARFLNHSRRWRARLATVLFGVILPSKLRDKRATYRVAPISPGV